MSKLNNYGDIEKEINERVGYDWNTPRTRAYLVATMANYKASLAALQQELNFEREVGKRTAIVLGEILSERKAQPGSPTR